MSYSDPPHDFFSRHTTNSSTTTTTNTNTNTTNNNILESLGAPLLPSTAFASSPHAHAPAAAPSFAPQYSGAGVPALSEATNSFHSSGSFLSLNEGGLSHNPPSCVGAGSSSSSLLPRSDLSSYIGGGGAGFSASVSSSLLPRSELSSYAGGGTAAAAAAAATDSTQRPGKRSLEEQAEFEKKYESVKSIWDIEKQKALEELEPDYRNHAFPIARIKRIMKSDEDVRTISADAPVLFSKACELFIMELTLRAWIHTEESKRRTLQKSDVLAALDRTEAFDFMADYFPPEDFLEANQQLSTQLPPYPGGPR